MRTSANTAPRLGTASLEVRPFSHETTLLVTPSGEHVLVSAPAQRLIALLERCDGTSSFGHVAAASAEPTATLRLLHALVDAGCLTTMEMEVSPCLEPSR
jgi:hypothetical protein